MLEYSALPFKEREQIRLGVMQANDCGVMLRLSLMEDDRWQVKELKRILEILPDDAD